MCDGKNSSKRDVVILSIKPKRPDYPTSQKYVPVNELLQEWDKLDAYYRGQLLKLTKSLSKKSKKHSSSRSRSSTKSITSNSSHHNNKTNGKHHHSSSKSSPVNKEHSSSLSSDQFTELFGDENLFFNDRGNNDSRDNKNKLLHSRSLNNLFEDPLDGSNSKSRSRKNSLTTANTNTNLLVSIPVLSVQQKYGGDDGESKIFSRKHKNKKLLYDNDDDDEDEENRSCASESEEDVDEDDKKAVEETKNFLSVPRDNFQVQYGTKQKTRVALLEADKVTPRWIVPVNVAPYKPPTAQGLNGVQIQKILYHKNDSLNYASPTTTTARTPDKPPDNLVLNHIPPPVTKSAKVSSNNSPVSTVSPRSTSSTANTTPASDNNNATPKQTISRTPELSSPKSDQGSSKSTSPTTAAGKAFSPPINSTTGGLMLKRPISSSDSQNSFNVNGKKPKLNNGEAGNTGYPNMPVSSSTYPSSNSSSDSSDNDRYGSSSNSQHNSGKDRDKDNQQQKGGNQSGSEQFLSPKKSPAINKPSGKFLKPSSTAAGEQQRPGTSSVFEFVAPAGISITDRIIKKASMPQPELLERQRRRRLESNQRKSYAMQMGDEHEQRESIELSMKSFEMIWSIPLLSPLRSP